MRHGMVGIIDKGDGVAGHVCIGRINNVNSTDQFMEYWNKNKFCSAGEVFTTPADLIEGLLIIIDFIGLEISDSARGN